MLNRVPIVAGQFYPSDKEKCISEIQQYLDERRLPDDLPSDISAAIVPHAGWVFSGSLAAMAFNSIKQSHQNVDTFIIFGAAHSQVTQNIIFDRGLWTTPMGAIEVNEMIAKEILQKCPEIRANRREHTFEHSIEVQIPFIQYLFPKAKIVPVLVPPIEDAVACGKQIADIVKNSDKKIIFIGSTDLTHYGPSYGFEKQGSGQGAIKWAKDVNDMAIINDALEMNEQELLGNSLMKHNSCGPGAVSATVSAAKALGKKSGRLLAHEHSNDIMKDKFNQLSDESVGYAAIVY